jgi:hypothetical protein
MKGGGRTLILGPMVADLSHLLDAIEAVLREPPAGGEAAVARIEDTLTDGYARALELEAERWRLERKIGEVARQLTGDDVVLRAEELAGLSKRLSSADGDLRRLRGRLADLRQHAEAVRAA